MTIPSVQCWDSMTANVVDPLINMPMKRKGRLKTSLLSARRVRMLESRSIGSWWWWCREPVDVQQGSIPARPESMDVRRQTTQNHLSLGGWWRIRDKRKQEIFLAFEYESSTPNPTVAPSRRLVSSPRPPAQERDHQPQHRTVPIEQLPPYPREQLKPIPDEDVDPFEQSYMNEDIRIHPHSQERRPTQSLSSLSPQFDVDVSPHLGTSSELHLGVTEEGRAGATSAELNRKEVLPYSVTSYLESEQDGEDSQMFPGSGFF